MFARPRGQRLIWRLTRCHAMQMQPLGERILVKPLEESKVCAL